MRITVFTGDGRSLTKRWLLGKDGELESRPAGTMSSGTAKRVDVKDAQRLANIINGLERNQALSLGTIDAAFASVTTRDELAENPRPNTIARTKDYVTYREGERAFTLFDFDRKGMPPAVAETIRRLGGFWPSLVHVLPALRKVSRVMRNSTSSGIYRSDTGEVFANSGGIHAFIAVEDGADSERFLKALQVKCWFAGLGWLIVSKSGAILVRSIIDVAVGTGERLVFEGPPDLAKPLVQDVETRMAIAYGGSFLDTAKTCPPLADSDLKKFEILKAAERERLEPEIRKVIASQVKKIAKERGISIKDARLVAEQRCSQHVLLSPEVLPFYDSKFKNCTVGDVLDDPLRFRWATLADPLEGKDYGRQTAKIYLKDFDGTPWIRSFAHGGTRYELRRDAAHLKKKIEELTS